MLPELLIHADWGSDPRKRWMCRAFLRDNGEYYMNPAEMVGDLDGWFEEQLKECPPKGCLFTGFDFALGLPIQYADNAGIIDFKSMLPVFGSGKWKNFYDVCDHPNQINIHRPFYPYRPGGTAQQHLIYGLGVSSFGELRRECEKAHDTRNAASPLFWTLGSQQVGKSAIIGWRDLILPAMQDKNLDILIWPFDGSIKQLLKPGKIVISETYPAEYYHHLGVQFSSSKPGRKYGKRVQHDRAANAGRLIQWASNNDVTLSMELVDQIQDGFGETPNGEDQFDAVIGLFGMLNVILDNRAEGYPGDDKIRQIEGWIFGQTHF